MEGKEAIIADIMQKAENAAAGLIRDAEAERDEVLGRVREEEDRRRNEAVAAAERAAQALIARRQTLNELEARKVELAAKQQVIDAAFEEAAKKILNMTDHIYREYIGGLVERYAEDGDCVLVAERDVKRLHAEWLNAICNKTGKTLTLSEQTHNGRGGIILVGKRCDKNLTLETMLATLRESALTQVAERLFK